MTNNCVLRDNLFSCGQRSRPRVRVFAIACCQGSFRCDGHENPVFSVFGGLCGRRACGVQDLGGTPPGKRSSQEGLPGSCGRSGKGRCRWDRAPLALKSGFIQETDVSWETSKMTSANSTEASSPPSQKPTRASGSSPVAANSSSKVCQSGASSISRKRPRLSHGS